MVDHSVKAKVLKWIERDKAGERTLIAVMREGCRNQNVAANFHVLANQQFNYSFTKLAIIYLQSP